MATLPSGTIAISDLVAAFGGGTPHGLGEYYAGGGYVPAGWRVSGKSALPTASTGTNDLDRYRGGAFQRWIQGTVNVARGPDEPPGIYANECDVYGFNQLSGAGVLYGSMSGNSNDEGWWVGSVACISEMISGGQYGYLLNLAGWNSGPLSNPFDRALQLDIKIGGGSWNSYASADALVDQYTTMNAVYVRQLFWDVGRTLIISGAYNPWANLTVYADIGRMDYT